MAKTRIWSLLIVAWLGFLAAADVRLAHRPKADALRIEMSSTTDSVAQVFFDTGKGFQERESVQQTIRADSAVQTLVFPLPDAPVRAIRFDPIASAGAVHLQKAAIVRLDSLQEIRSLKFDAVTPLSQIERITPADGGLDIVTTPASADPALLFSLEAPLFDAKSAGEAFVEVGGIDISATAGALAVLGAIIYLRRNRWLLDTAAMQTALRPIAWVNTYFDRWSRQFSRPYFLRFDRLACWFYAGCLLFFLACALAGLHGSSLSMFSTGFFPYGDLSHHPLLGRPIAIRSDEWSFYTPAMLNSLFREERMAAIRSCLGPHRASLLGNIPIHHFTQIFRPEFWGFHLLPADLGLSFFWQAKGFLLLTGFFTLLLLLTGSSGLSLLGVFWFYFSAYTQWTFSWPSLLPDMIGLFCFVLCATLYMSVGRNPWRLALAGLICVVGAMDFALCSYPPQQIPLVLFGGGLLAWWLSVRRAEIFQQHYARRRLGALLGSWAFVLLIVALFYLQSRDTLARAAATVYPGQRVSMGGVIPIQVMLSHFLDFWKRDDFVPAPQGNICEASGYLWLAPATLLMLHRRYAGLPRDTRVALVVFWILFVIIALWMTLPIPSAAGALLFLHKVPAQRCLHALGLLNVTLVVLYLNGQRTSSEQSQQLPSRWSGRILFLLGATLLAGGAFLAMNRVYDGFFAPAAIGVAAGFTAWLALCLVERRSGVFAISILLPLIAANAGINPLDRGISSLVNSPLSQAVRQHPELKGGRWLAFSRDFEFANFASGLGLDVFNSLKILPDLDSMAVFDPAGKFRDQYNRSGYIVAMPLEGAAPSSFGVENVNTVLWNVSPQDPGLRRLGIRHVIFDYPPPPALVVGLTPTPGLVGLPHMWTYELP